MYQVVHVFFIPRCGPCQRIAPVFEEMARRFPNAVFLKIDVNQCPTTSASQGVTAAPTFIFFRNKVSYQGWMFHYLWLITLVYYRIVSKCLLQRQPFELLHLHNSKYSPSFISRAFSLIFHSVTRSNSYCFQEDSFDFILQK